MGSKIKYLLLLGSLAGVAGMFMPLAGFGTSGDDFTDAIAGGVYAEHSLFSILTSNDPDAADAKAGVIMIGAPIVLLALVGLVSVVSAFGRGKAVLALLLALASAGLWYVLFAQFQETELVVPALGMWLMAAAPATGALAGLIGLVSPESKDGKDD